MANPHTAELEAALRLLPSTDELINASEISDLMQRIGRRRGTTMARAAIDSVRSDLAKAINSAGGYSSVYSRESLLDTAKENFTRVGNVRAIRGLRKVINATGVVVHTNLGRAPLSDNARRAIEDATGYCTIEYDLETGKRGRRGARVEEMLEELTGAEGAVVVNNCAAAAYLVLSVFARGGEVVVSRGELVEIGGDFRVPDVLIQSGAELREVGTTNRTKLQDYDRAIGDRTNVVMTGTSLEL